MSRDMGAKRVFLILRDVAAFMLAFNPDQFIGCRKLAGGLYMLFDDPAKIGGIVLDRPDLVTLHATESLRLHLIFVSHVVFHTKVTSGSRARFSSIPLSTCTAQLLPMLWFHFLCKRSPG